MGEGITTDSPHFDVVAAIEEAADTRACVTFYDLDGRRSTVGADALWRRSAQARDYLQNVCGRHGVVGGVFVNSEACVAAVLGALRGGMTIVSLPTPRRDGDLTRYRAQLASIVRAHGLHTVLFDGLYAPSMRESGLDITVYDELTERHAPQGIDAGGAELVQFTSGSTSDPRGIRLPISAIGSNIAAILAAIEPRPGDASCCWLPISHDMGLIGLLLSSLAAGSRNYANGGECVVIRPELFAMNPSLWMRAVSDHKVTITGGPPFGWAIARRVLPSQPLDLSSLRVCLVGADHIDPEVLRAFARTAEPLGFQSLAFCPAYGLAEASVAVTMVRPSEHWTSKEVAVREGVDGGPRHVELVGNGRPLPGIEVVAGADDAHPSRVRVASPGLAECYTTGPLETDSNGWLVTHDLGFRDGERDDLYVLGRTDDVVCVAGRNLYPNDLETALSHDAAAPVGPGRVAVVPFESGYALIAEFRPTESETSTAALDAARANHIAATRCCGIAPVATVVVPKGEIPKTTSGKLRRRDAQSLIGRAALATYPTPRGRSG